MWRFSRDRQVHEELVQDVFVEAYLNLHTYRGKAPFSHWLSRIATRVGYRHWKQMDKKRGQKHLSLQDWDQIAVDKAERMDPDDAAKLVHSFLAHLAPRDRMVLTLRYLEECDVNETAKQTGWSKTMVKVQTWRALRRLEKLFIETGKDMVK